MKDEKLFVLLLNIYIYINNKKIFIIKIRKIKYHNNNTIKKRN